LSSPKAFTVGDTNFRSGRKKISIPTWSVIFPTWTLIFPTWLPFFPTWRSYFPTEQSLTKIPIRNTHQATADGAIQELFSSQSRDIGVQNLEYCFHFTLNQK